MIRTSPAWAVLLTPAIILALAYLYFTLFPGSVPPLAYTYFSQAEVAQGRRYQQLMALIYFAALAAKFALLAWLVLGGRAQGWAARLPAASGGRYYASLILMFLVVWLLLRAVALPFSFWAGFVVQHQWGFSTQSLAAWVADYVKGAGLDLALSGIGTLLFFWATGRWPTTWWLPAGLFLTGWLLVSTFLWPILISPLFNRFQPVTAGPVYAMAMRLAERAGLEVDQVLIMDASRRTTKANAYYSGLGRTQRIVLYDNLINKYRPAEVEAVVAHELAHWRQGHIVKGIALGAAGGFLALLLLYAFLRLAFPGLGQGPYPPYLYPAILLFYLAVGFAVQPLENGISRALEYEADRVAVSLTQDPDAAVELQKGLARLNRADVSPPAFIEWLAYTHPGPLKRIEAIARGGL